MLIKIWFRRRGKMCENAKAIDKKLRLLDKHVF